MANTSGACLVQVNSGAFVPTTTGVDCSPGDTITVKLASEAGLKSWSLYVTGTDNNTSAPGLTFEPGPPFSYTFTFPAGSGGSVGFQSIVNGGVDVNNRVQATYFSRFGVFAKVGANRLFFTGQMFESSPFGWIADLNNFIRNGGAGGDATSLQGTPVLSTPPTSFQVLGSLDGISWGPVSLTSDWVAAGFSPTLSINAGGTGPKEIGDIWGTPLNFTANPLANAAGVTSFTIKDSLGGSQVRTGAGPYAAPQTGYTLNSAGTVNVFATVVKGGVSKNTGNVSCSWVPRVGWGCDTDGGGTGFTASGNNLQLTGGSTTTALPGSIPLTFGVGSLFSLAPSGNQYGYLAAPHTTNPHTFKQGGFTFAMSRITSNLTFTNQFTQAVPMDLYRTDNMLAVNFNNISVDT